MEIKYLLVFIEKGDNYEKHAWYDDALLAASDFNTMTQVEPECYTYVKLNLIEIDPRTFEGKVFTLGEWF